MFKLFNKGFFIWIFCNFVFFISTRGLNEVSGWGTGAPETIMPRLWDWKLNQLVATNGPRYAYMQVAFDLNDHIFNDKK